MNSPLPQYSITRTRNITLSFPRAREFEQKVVDCFDLAQRVFSEHRDRLRNLDRVPIVFYSSGTTAGWAKYHPYYNIEFNAYLIQNNWDTMVNSTIPHEVAHLVDHMIYGRSSGHGIRWQKIATALGDTNTGERLHTMKTKRARRTKRHQYVMPSGREEWISTTIHNRIQGGQFRYFRDTGEHLLREHCTGKVKMVG